MSKMNICINPTTKKQKQKNRKVQCANARSSMSRKAYKEFTERERNTVGQGLHSVVFESKKNNKKEMRREGKRLCRETDASYYFVKIYCI